LSAVGPHLRQREERDHERADSNDGRRLIMNYEKDGFYDYLKHLLHSPICREYVCLSYDTVLVWFSRLVKARQHFIQYVFTNPQR
jgi:hypothetical protein